MKKIYRLLSVLMIASMLIICAGCGSETTAYERNAAASGSAAQSSSASGDTAGLKIAYSAVAAEESAPWAGVLWNELQQMCEENGWEFDGMSAGGVPAQQADQIDQLIADDPDYMVILAGDKTMADEWVKKVHRAGIPVIMAGTDATASAYNEVSAYVGEDQEALSSQLASDMISANGNSAGLNVVAISGFSVQQDYILREQGFEKTLEYFSNYNLLATGYAGASRENAKSIMADYLNNYDDIDAVMCYDSEFALGALEAIDEAGKTGSIQVYTITASKEVLEKMQEGSITECAVNSASDIADQVAETINGLENGIIPNHYVYTDREYITSETAAEYTDSAEY